MYIHVFVGTCEKIHVHVRVHVQLAIIIVHMYIHVHCTYMYYYTVSPFSSTHTCTCIYNQQCTCIFMHIQQVKKDHVTGKSRGFGFVRFYDPAVQDKVQSMQHTIKDRRIDIKHPRKVRGYIALICEHQSPQADGPVYVCTHMYNV